MAFRIVITSSNAVFSVSGVLLIQGYYKLFIRFQNAILSKVLHVQIRLICETNRKLTKFSAHSTNVLCVPLGSRDTRPGGSQARSTHFVF
jgi:hypothetical protein